MKDELKEEWNEILVFMKGYHAAGGDRMEASEIATALSMKVAYVTTELVSLRKRGLVRQDGLMFRLTDPPRMCRVHHDNNDAFIGRRFFRFI